ncbi:DUF1488 domain-containing protein [Roseomonas sp. NAR14]|uniref:DUF1488 domain-containing protein n=1 Tax=Roseomonas acroporae TaxID=2937791 RepID=A0A9X1Y4V3_9PROT|nr:DUF1488 family protein [Roseomonas acroporae]MCK8783157.1 DUF1488 domain-containing protein [Roseomonas acroporae]
MQDESVVSAPVRASWDGNRMLFEIACGDDRIACAISRGALQDLSEHRRFRPAELIDCFAKYRPRIEALALAKYRARSKSNVGRVHIWAEDIEGPPAGLPRAAPRTASRSVP